MAAIVACQPRREKLNYPMTSKVDTIDHYFGTQVSDPYRWLEDDNSDSTKAWVSAQNAVTNDYLSKIPYRSQMINRLTKLWDYPRISAPFHEGGRYFVFKNNGLQNQSVAFMFDTLGAHENIILDPNTFSEDGTVSLTNFSPSDDGKYLGYGISKGGSDWNEFFIKDLQTGQLLNDRIEWVKFSGIEWFKDGFFYSRYPAPKEGDMLKGVNENSKIYYHKIGNSQDQDQLVYEDPKNPNWGFGASVTDDEKLLVITVTESTSGNAFYVRDIQKSGKIIKVVESFDKDFQVVDHQNGKLLVMTNYQAPKYKVIAIDLNDIAPEKWVDFIPEKEGVLTDVSIIGGKTD